MNNNDNSPCIDTFFSKDHDTVRFHCYLIHRRAGKRKYYFSYLGKKNLKNSGYHLCTFEEFRNILGNFYYDYVKRCEFIESFMSGKPERSFYGPLTGFLK